MPAKQSGVPMNIGNIKATEREFAIQLIGWLKEFITV